MSDIDKKNNSDSKGAESEDAAVFYASIPPPPLGRNRIGRYEIIYPIAQGGMASVYAGRLSGIAGFQRLVAVKVVHSHLAAEDRFIKMFLDEARLAAEIHHPNVAEILEVGQDDGLFYMVCELILGQSLRAVFRRADQKGMVIPPVVSARIVSKICLALHAAHELKGEDGKRMGLVHRDVSPRNILLTYDGFVKLIDFGVAYAQGRISHSDVGTLKGKIGYMSPEQLRCDPVDRRSDIFSLGVVLYQIVANRQPFYGETDIERLNKIMRFEFEKPCSVVKGLDPRLERIILKAMARSPADRYPTAAALDADLAAFIGPTNESVESEHLSKIMHSLFKAEHAYHLEKVRECRRNDEDPELSAMAAMQHNLKKTSPSLPRLIPKPEPSLADVGEKRASVTLNAILLSMFLAGIAVLFLLRSPVSEEDKAKMPPRGMRAERSPLLPKNRSLKNSHARAPDSVGIAEEHTAVKEDVVIREVKISLTLFPKNTSVVLDGISMGVGVRFLSLSADKSLHRLRFFAKGYRDKFESVRADKDKTINITLVPHKKGNRKKSAVRKTGPASPKKKPPAI